MALFNRNKRLNMNTFSSFFSVLLRVVQGKDYVRSNVMPIARKTPQGSHVTQTLNLTLKIIVTWLTVLMVCVPLYLFISIFTIVYV